MPIGIFQCYPAGVVELVDTRDLKSRGPQGSWGFKSPPRHQIIKTPNHIYLSNIPQLVFDTLGSLELEKPCNLTP